MSMREGKWVIKEEKKNRQKRVHKCLVHMLSVCRGFLFELGQQGLSGASPVTPISTPPWRPTHTHSTLHLDHRCSVCNAHPHRES